MSEAKKSKQVQKSGNSSVNIQAGQITVGVNYEDAKAIFLDLFKSNFHQLSDIAKDTAQKRAEEITSEFLDELIKKNPEGLNSTREPDFQYALFTVQKEYAKSGDKDLGSILVDILVDRSKEVNRNLMQIVLNESLQTASKLTNDQYAALSVMFVLKYTRYSRMLNFKEFSDYIDRMLSPFVPELVKEAACYQHLEYAGCGTIRFALPGLSAILLKNYPLLFVKPFSKEELADLFSQEPSLSTMITPSRNDNDQVEPYITDEAIIREISRQSNIEDSTIDDFIASMRKHAMNAQEAKDYAIKAHPCMTILYDVWENSHVKDMALTSVGIAIANANIRRVLGNQLDLSIWIK